MSFISMPLSPRSRYFLSSLGQTLLVKGRACPSCGSKNASVVARKYLVTALRRCPSCGLLFRTPTTSAEDSARYYRSDYASDFTTDLPDSAALATFLDTAFQDTPKDFTRYIEILNALGFGLGHRVLDFGCSWGYGSWQFKRHGFDVVAFDVSSERVRFARENLSVDVVESLDSVDGTVDVFFSAHVMEHVPSAGNSIKRGLALLPPGGMMVTVTPNGSQAYRQRNPGGWQRSWGLKHPNLLDEEFYANAFEGCRYLLTSNLSDGHALKRWAQGDETEFGTLKGWELLAVCQKSTGPAGLDS